MKATLLVVIVGHRFVAGSIRAAAAQRLVPGSVATLAAHAGCTAELAGLRGEFDGVFDETDSELVPAVEVALERLTLWCFEVCGAPALPRLVVSEQARLLGWGRGVQRSGGLRVTRIGDALNITPVETAIRRTSP